MLITALPAHAFDFRSCRFATAGERASAAACACGVDGGSDMALMSCIFAMITPRYASPPFRCRVAA